MTESDWLQATDPEAMIAFLREERTHFRTRWVGHIPAWRRFRVSERRWRLFYCACVRRIQHLLPVQESRDLIDVAEKFANGKANEDELRRAVAASMSACNYEQARRYVEQQSIAWSEIEAINAISRFHRSEEGGRGATLRSAARAWAAAVSVPAAWEGEQAAESARQAALLREVLGNPFHKTLVDPAWLAWQGGTVSRLARAIGDERRYADLPILADALEDAGCCDEALLGHFRSRGEHVLGCWGLDAVLGID